MGKNEIKSMYGKDCYLLLLNLVINRNNEHDVNLWNKYAAKSLSSLKFNENIEDEFEIFNKWNDMKKMIPSNKFLQYLFYGARLDNINQEKAHDYLNYVICDFFLFLTENMYHRFTYEYLQNNNVNTIYTPLFDGKESYWFSLVMHKIQSYVKIDYSQYKKHTQKFNDFSENPVHILVSLEQELTKIFKNNNELNTLPTNVFNISNYTSTKLDTSEKIVIGIGSLGCSTAMANVLKQENPSEYKLILFGGGNNLLCSKIHEWYKDYYQSLTEKNINFVCFFVMDEKPHTKNTRLQTLNKHYYSPYTPQHYNDSGYDVVFLHCLKKTPNFIKTIVQEYNL